MKILVTGATGNVGGEVVRQAVAAGHRVYAGTRSGQFDAPHEAVPVNVDFQRDETPALDVDAIFLMRPPQLAQPAPFARFLNRFDRKTRIVFLSVLGAERRPYLPHARIEKRIADLGFEHVFVRPSYFMDNLLTTLWPELRRNRRIYLPAGSLRLDWISVRDVAAISLAALSGRVDGPAIEACSGRMHGFADVCKRITDLTGVPIRYEAAGVAEFVRHQRRHGADWPFVAVMLLLHFVPRLRPETARSCEAARGVLGRETEDLDAFIGRNGQRFHALGKPGTPPPNA